MKPLPRRSNFEERSRELLPAYKNMPPTPIDGVMADESKWQGNAVRKALAYRFPMLELDGRPLSRERDRYQIRRFAIA